MPAKKRKIDFTKVKDRGQFNPRHMPEGDYRAVVTDVKDAKAQETGRPMWVFTLKAAGGTYPYRCMLAGDNVFWKVKNLMEACGFQVPKRVVDTDPNKLVGKKLGVSLVDHEYNGKMSSEIAQVFHAKEFDDDEGRVEGAGGVEVEDEDEAPRRTKKPVAEEIEDEEEDEDEDEEEQPPPRQRQRTRQVVEDDEDEDVGDEDVEDEPPARRAARTKSKPRQVVEEDDEDVDDLDEIDIEEM